MFSALTAVLHTIFQSTAMSFIIRMFVYVFVYVCVCVCTFVLYVCILVYGGFDYHTMWSNYYTPFPRFYIMSIYFHWLL